MSKLKKEKGKFRDYVNLKLKEWLIWNEHIQI